MSGALTRAMHTLGQHTVVSVQATETGTKIAAGATSAPIALPVAGLLVTIALAVIGWIIVDKRRAQGRAADVDNDDLNELITLLRSASAETRRVSALPRPADRADFQEFERLIPHLESHGTQAAAPLDTLVRDVVQDMKDVTGLPVDNSIPIGEYGVRVQQQTRAVDRLLAAIDKALTSARQMRR